MRRARLLPLLVSLAVAPAALPAQWQLSGDVGASHLKRSDIPQSGAVTLGGSANTTGEWGWFRSSLLGVVAGANQTAGQGLIAGSLIGPGARARGELSGILSAFSETGAGSTVSGEVMARAQFGLPTRGGAVGLGTGSTAHDGSRNALYHAAGDAWWTARDNQFAGTLSAIRTATTFSDGVRTVRVPRSYLDLSGAWRRDRGGLVLGANGGVRRDLRSGGVHRAWGSAEATAWVSTRSAIVLSGGRTLDDPVRGLPRTTFLSLSLHVTGQPHLSLWRPRATPGVRLAIERAGEGRKRIEVRGIAASRVDIMGDFTGWDPIPLEAHGDTWRVERAISSGLHRIALRIDGGEWIAPINLPRATDDLGGVVGLITVP